MIELVILLLASYMTGSFPTSIVVTRVTKNIDITKKERFDVTPDLPLKIIGVD